MSNAKIIQGWQILYYDSSDDNRPTHIGRGGIYETEEEANYLKTKKSVNLGLWCKYTVEPVKLCCEENGAMYQLELQPTTFAKLSVEDENNLSKLKEDEALRSSTLALLSDRQKEVLGLK